MKPPTGHVILLNGPSSAGKTTIARCLQEILERPYLQVSIDGFLAQLPSRILGVPRSSATFLSILIDGFHAAVAAIARAGNPLIVDHVLLEENWIRSFVQSLQGLRVTLVGVVCPIDVLERRERKRRDRQPGLARDQSDRVHRAMIHDLVVDSSQHDPDVCAALIRDALRGRATAFSRLARRRALATRKAQ